MLEATVKKLIAWNGERKIIDSSHEEMRDFITEKIRPDFLDENILGVKFLVFTGSSLSDAEETSWYINPIHSVSCIQFNEFSEPDFESDFEQDYCYFSSEPSESKIASEFLPELLLLMPRYPNVSILEKYSEFRNKLILAGIEDISDVRKYQLFIHWLKKNI